MKKSKGAYESARKNKWLNEICKHMIVYYKVDKYNKEICLELVNKCKTIDDFYKKYNAAYQACVRNGWLIELTKDLKRTLRIVGFWTQEKCIEFALKCKTKKEFITKYGGAYSTCLENNWIDELYNICNFNTDINYLWSVYSYNIQNKYIYIGITTDINLRKYTHLSSTNSSVYNFIKNNFIKNKDIYYKVEVDNISDIKTIKKLEEHYLNYYLNNGFIKINKIKTGGIGRVLNLRCYSMEECSEMAKKYKIISDFKKENLSMYNQSKKNGWLNQICSHMNIRKKWTEKECKDLLKKCKTLKEFRKYSRAYQLSLRNGWLDEMCSNIERRSPNGYWNNKERCFEESKKYKNRTEFRKNRSAYNYSILNGWINDFYKKEIDL